MKCNEIKNKMMEFLFNELSEDENKLIKNHIKSCKECSAELESFNSTVKAMEKWPEIEPEEKMVFVAPKTGLIENVKKLFQSKSKRPGVLRWTGRLAVAAIVLAILVFRSEISYYEGQFSLKIGSNQETTLPTSSPEMVNEIKKLQNDIFYIQQMLAESNKQNRELVLTGLQQLSRKMDDQRVEDLVLLGQKIQRVEKSNLYNIEQTKSLGDYIRTVTAYPERK
jgi:hypothetical protein